MKGRRRSPSVLFFGFVAVMGILAAGFSRSQESTPTATQETMRALFVVLSQSYRYSLNAAAFEDPVNHDEIGGLLSELAQQTGQLEKHGGGLDPSFDFVRRSFARDAKDAQQDFRDANYPRSRFIVGAITENCVTCHTKLPAEQPFDAGKEFLTAISAKNFPPAVRAKLQVAGRQFSDAMKTYEEAILSPMITVEDLGTFNTFENYLRVSIGALSDTKRPVPTLEQFLRRADAPDSTKAEARAWMGSLQALSLDVSKGEELAAAQPLVAAARESTKSMTDQSRMVDFIGAITLLHRYLRSEPANEVNVAEAYYLLGVSESYVSRSFWISETDYLLEKSIRQAPKSEVAKQALAFLEEYRNTGSSSARPVPPEMQTDIKELRKLMGH